MRFVLTSYQETATADVLRWLRRGTADFASDGDYNAVSLSAPTGAGKTVIAASVIERLFAGDADAARDPNATVLWVTDDPSLNEQTRRKMIQASSSLTTGQLVTVDAGFDQAEFDRNRVYFLNIQKLGRSTSYVTGGTDARRYSLWTTIGNTIRAIGGHFYVIVDEAHRGARATADRQTIVARIIADSTGAIPPVPVVWGISATPDRFNAAMAAAAVPARSQHPVTVPPEEVQASGLIKDKVLIKHPTEKQPSDSTLTRLAVSDLTAMTDAWGDYSAAEGEPPVRPALVIQVRPSITDADIATILETLADADGTLAGRALGHSFQDHSALAIGSRTVRYIAPQDIHDDAELRVVLFKEALTTGWDCPRAEVMLSLRPARDTTYIAQLIGRMVRTPLAKRIVTNEALNTVSLYLPHYDAASVDAVIERFRTDPDAPPVEIEANAVTCKWNPAVSADALDALQAVPTYTVPGRVHRSQVARLNTLATRLVGDTIDETALDAARSLLCGTLDAQAASLDSDGTLSSEIAELKRIDYRTVEVTVADGTQSATAAAVAADARNINDLLRGARRGLRDGLAQTYWSHLVDGGTDESEAKLKVAALAANPTVVEAVESAAETQVRDWLRAHSAAITALGEAKRAAYYEVHATARVPEVTTLIMPDEIVEGAGPDEAPYPRWERHVYAGVDDKKTYPAKLTSWEQEVLEAELNPDQPCLAWYRNPRGGKRAVRIPYDDGSRTRSMYPDFVFIHDTPDGIRPSIVDPHNYNLGDAAAKLRGLAAYASTHGGEFARIDAVVKDPEGNLLRLDLKDPTNRTELESAAGPDTVLSVFRSHGGHY